MSDEPPRGAQIREATAIPKSNAIAWQTSVCLGLGALIQAMKILEFMTSASEGTELLVLLKKWLIIELVFSLVIMQHQISQLSFTPLSAGSLISILWASDAALLWAMSPSEASGFESVRAPQSDQAPSEPFNILSFLPFVMFMKGAAATAQPHLFGKHSIRMSPVNTAQLNPDGLPFCLGASGGSVFIPVLFHNVKLAALRYSFHDSSKADEGHAKSSTIDLSPKQLKSMETEFRKHQRQVPSMHDITQTALSASQSLAYIRINRPGTIRLERVLDTSRVDSRVLHPQEVTVVQCPRAEFAETENTEEDIRCAGESGPQKLMVDVFGLTPLTLRWSRIINGKREHFISENIDHAEELGRQRGYSPQSLDDRDAGGRRKIEGLANKRSSEIRHPLTVSLDAVGDHLYTLDEVIDATGNAIRVGSHIITTDQASTGKTKTSRSFVVLRRPSVSFSRCGPGNPTPLLAGNEAFLTISANTSESFDARWEVVVKYEPSRDSNESFSGGKRPVPWEKTFQPQGSRRDVSFPVTTAGAYSLVQVKGKWCTGDVVFPITCQVIEQPLPVATVNWKGITDCFGDKGLVVSFAFQGSPPFHVTYQYQRDQDMHRIVSKSFPHPKGELVLEPVQGGRYTYTFLHLGDANYRKVDMPGPTIVHEIAAPLSATFVGIQTEGRRMVLNSCDSGTVAVDIDLEGRPPWQLELQIDKAHTMEIPNINIARATLHIPVPATAEKSRRPFEVDLVSLIDARGCKKSLSYSNLLVKLKAAKPTAKFADRDGQESITILEGEHTSLPLRLTGDGPWRVQYRNQALDHLALTTTLTAEVASIPVAEQGTYEIIEIMDSQCKGVVESPSTFKVNWVPRPSAKLAPDTPMTIDGFNNSHILKPICQGMDDYVELNLSGSPPFQIIYDIARRQNVGEVRLTYQPLYNSVSHRTRLQLHTDQPGRVFYQIQQLGDAAYPLTPYQPLDENKHNYVKFEQQVAFRPSARFKSFKRLSYYLNEQFVPSNRRSSDGLILLEGTPPFQIQLSVRNPETKQVDTLTAESSASAWKIDLPSYRFRAVGEHILTIDAIVDSSNCGRAVLDKSRSSLLIDVLSTASIVPLDGRTDFCIGDVARFSLDGTPPWVIGYQMDGQPSSKEIRTSPFSLPLERPGDFAITSITSGNIRKVLSPSLRFTIHALPAALVGHGKDIDQDIIEGDQAEILFTLIGEPPFTFTYQRSELGGSGRVLETNTVSHVNSHTYSLRASLEGTWTMSAISDKYCQYPPPVSAN